MGRPIGYFNWNRWSDLPDVAVSVNYAEGDILERTDTLIIKILDAGNIFESFNLDFSSPFNPASFDFFTDDPFYSSDLMTLTIPFNDARFDDVDFDNSNRFNLSGSSIEGVVEPTNPEFVTSLVTVYKANQGILNLINGVRWGEGVDYAEYIFNLYSLPIKIPEGLVGDNYKMVKLGNFETTVQSEYLKDNKIIYDLGNIVVPEIYNNVFDYKGVECVLHVPYSDPIVLDSGYVIGSTINLKLIVDLYNRYVTLNVYSDKTDALVLKSEINLCQDIPYINDTNKGVFNSIGKYRYNELVTSFIEVIRPIPYSNPDSPIGVGVNQYGNIGIYTGYIEINNLNLISNATDDEKNDIINLLASGVYVK